MSDLKWGLYAFEQDVVWKSKLTKVEKQHIINEAIICGYNWAEHVKKTHGDHTVTELADRYHLKVESDASGQMTNRIAYAIYTPPRTITLMTEPIAKVRQLLNAYSLFSTTHLPDIILAHELFHHIESNEKDIYTQAKQVTLWRFLFYKHRSQIRATSEIAAMSFSKQMNGLDFSPFVLDFLLIYAYNPLRAGEMYQQLIQ